MIEISVAALAASFESGEHVYLAGSSGEANELTELLADSQAKVADASFTTTFVPGINARCLTRPGFRSRGAVFFMQPCLATALDEGRIDFRPITYFGIHRYLSDVNTRIDTVVAQVAPQDTCGHCSLGPAVEFMPAVLNRAKRVIGIINPSVPRLEGSVSIHMDRFDAVARSTRPLTIYDVGRTSPVAAQIVSHLAPLIPNGATVQIGLGKIPSQLLNALTQHRELALHTGMISDAALQLAASGALRRQRPIVSSVAVGSAEFYASLPEMRDLILTEIGVTHAPQTLANVRHFYAVNSALEVDLLGQVNAEVLDGQYVSGPGGLPDFAHAAHADAEGLSIIALNSTDASGAISRIVSRLGDAAPVIVPQHDVDAVVTDHGVALLRGQPIDERARRLCAVAHPRHRAALERSARQLLRQH